MREAIGQLMTRCDQKQSLWLQFLNNGKARELAVRWSKLTQIKTARMKFALMSEDGSVRLI